MGNGCRSWRRICRSANARRRYIWDSIETGSRSNPQSLRIYRCVEHSV